MIDIEEKYFRAIPWCAKLLNNSDFTIFPTSSRKAKASTEDGLFARTLKTDSTVQACLSLYKPPAHGVSNVDELRTLFSIGDGLNGHAHMCHGGIVATLMDEAIGELMVVNWYLKMFPTGMATVTAYLNVSYLKPVTTPQNVQVVSKLREVKGRKYYVDASMMDSTGTVLAKAESLLIAVKRFKESL